MKQNNEDNIKIIGLTGGIATGKSTVANILKQKGYPVIDADKIAREVVGSGKPAYKDIIEFFGDEILNEDNSINREKLGEIIFRDQVKRQILNDIVHPRVTEEMKRKTKEFSKENKVVFLDIPLLIEVREKLEDSGLVFEQIWLVYTNEEQQLKRLMQRDNLDEAGAYRRIRSQMPIDEKMKQAEIIIDNTKGFDELIKIINKKLKQFN